MKPVSDNSAQKLRGAFYTPLEAASAMVRLSFNAQMKTMLEPSCGEGVFFEAIGRLRLGERFTKMHAVEIDKAAADKTRLLKEKLPALEVFNEDFFDFYKRNRGKSGYDLIAGNPPYIRFQYLTKQQRTALNEICAEADIRVSRMSNAWAVFLVCCARLLSEQGTMAMVVPSEVLQVSYASDIRRYLAAHFASITLITFERLIFEALEQEVVILICRKQSSSRGIRILELQDLDDLKDLAASDLNPGQAKIVDDKWTRYFIDEHDQRILESLKSDPRLMRMDECCRISVGITTGNNRYFCVDEKTAQEYDLKDICLPLVGRSSQARGICFTRKDWEHNRSSGLKAYLVQFPSDVEFERYPQRHKDYIALGEERKENLGFKCSIRDRWYIVPSVWVSDAFFLRRNNRYPKLALNCCNAVSTDTMHRLSLKEGMTGDDLLISYYNSISLAFTEVCGRSYGGGVLEILPKEAGKIMLARPENLDPEVKEHLLKLIDEAVRQDKDLNEALDETDRLFLAGHLGFDLDVCRQCRQIWLKLQSRRLKRHRISSGKMRGD